MSSPHEHTSPVYTVGKQLGIQDNLQSAWLVPCYNCKPGFCKRHFALRRWQNIYLCLAATTWIWIIFRFRERKDSSCQGSSSQFSSLYLQGVWLASQQAGKATDGKLTSRNQNECMRVEPTDPRIPVLGEDLTWVYIQPEKADGFAERSVLS